VNTRLQVEHPVTELVTGLDLVQLQLRIAAGELLPFSQADIAWRGSAIECRICAEDPENQFFPSPGKIVQLEEPSGPGIRLDSGVYQGWTVPLDYDPLLAKLVAWGADRNTAIQRMLRALHEYSILGVENNLAFFREILDDPQFREGRLDTNFVGDFFARRRPPSPPSPDLEMAVALVAAAHYNTQAKACATSEFRSSRWLTEGRDQLQR